MATLTEDMQQMLKDQLSFLATADAAGDPQVGPKGTMRVLDAHHLIYNEHTAKQAWANLQASHKAAVAVVDHAKFKGYRFEGLAEFHTDDQIYEDALAYAKAHQLPPAVAAVVIPVQRIYKLDAGPNAGDLIDGEAI
ncbi:pyridoxamine 5'-phosphate oxidase family protein [Lacticaseibacillus daqingensis]|uniref:pyridoxamine 5'-phosphate oxidase family protein n=1 Tax=Lacticaseibacillus daqingensis TaxID=2486014 RepID=UPI000F79647D|nr:pyridoxamine 5'-phosphate oxidase family protein [Lacticaseibacillus daqingensis]